MKLPIACVALWNKEVINIVAKMSLNSCLDTCNLSAKRIMTASESVTPLGSPPLNV